MVPFSAPAGGLFLNNCQMNDSSRVQLRRAMLVLPGNCSRRKTRSEHHVTQIPRNAFTQPLSVGRGRNRPFFRTRPGWQSVHGRATDDRPLLSTFSKPPVSLFGSGTFKSPSKVQFDFWISNADTKCPAKNVTVSWAYTIADQETKAPLYTTTSWTVVPSVFQSIQHIYVNCTPNGANTYCKSAYAWLHSSSGGPSYSIGNPNASIGLVAP
jgi:hypothetical protein